MSIFNNINQRKFWRLFINFAFPFLLFVTVFSLLINSFSDIFSANFSAVNTTNFSDGKWIAFFAPKFVLSIAYGLYMANKNIKSEYK